MPGIEAQQLELPPENVFGHAKKLKFVISCLDQSRLKAGAGINILDVGCGSGYAVTRFLPASSDRALGIDLFAPNIEYAQQHFSGRSLEFKLMRAEEVKAIGRKFEVVVLSDVLEHVDHPGQLLVESTSLLKEGGSLLVSIPNGRGPFEIESFIFRIPILGSLIYFPIMWVTTILNKFVLKHFWEDLITPKDLPYNAASGHVHFFSYSRFCELISQSNLNIVQRKKLSFLSGPYTNTIWARSKWFCRLNNRVADWLPACWVSAWAFELRVKTPLKD